MRKEIIAGNWKMNHTPKEALAFLRELKISRKENQRVVLCPSFVCIASMLGDLPEGVELSSQNVHQEESGAYS